MLLRATHRFSRISPLSKQQIIIDQLIINQRSSISFIPQFLKTGVNTVTGAVTDGVNIVTDAVTDTKDHIIAKGIMQNVGTLNAVKKEMRDRGEPDPITISLTVNLGVANVNLTSQYIPPFNNKNDNTDNQKN